MIRMVDYISKAPDTDFSSLVEDDEFKKDLVRFFSGGRYKYTREEILDRGFENLTKDFVEHMRAQSWNEVTAVKDLNYVKNKDFGQKGKDAFARLTQAWDNSESVGSSWGDAIGDFSEAILTAPSTYAGFGAGKLVAKAGSKGLQLAVRSGLKQATQKNVTQTGLRRLAQNRVAQETASGAVAGAGLGALQAGAQGETREELAPEEYEYTKKDLIFDAVIGGTIGAAGGAISGKLSTGRTKAIDEVLAGRSDAFKKEAETAAVKVEETFKNANPEFVEKAGVLLADLDDILAARAGDKKAKIRNRLDPERVQKGQDILKKMSDKKLNPEFSSGLSAATMRGIAAAAIDLQGNYNIKSEAGDLLISDVIARKLQEEGSEEVFGVLDTIKDKYNLTNDEFSLIYLAEASRAGQILGFQSAIKRGAKLNDKMTKSIDVLYERGSSSISGVDAREITAAAERNVKGNKGMNFLRDVDALRVAFMTAQPATTMRNITSTGILVGADMSDQFFKALFKGVTGDTQAIRNIVPDMSSVLRGLNVNKVEASLLKQIMLDEMPETAKRVYTQTMRLELGNESNSVLAKAGRVVNIANTLSDTVLKETIMYGDLDRQFRAQGLSLTDWLRSNTKLDNLPEGISMDDAVKAANSMTMQDTFRDSSSVVGKGTRALVDLNRKVPFLVSTAMGIPFPRYLGNHLQKMSEYAPVVGGLLQHLGVTDQIEDRATRYARQATGAMMLWGGHELAEQRQGEVDYGSIKNTLIQEFGDDADLKPLLGATMAHMYVGDLIWRRQNGLPAGSDDIEKFIKDMEDVFGGIPEFSFDISLFTGPLSGDEKLTEASVRKLADFFATFTMPLAVTRDLIGQSSYDAAGSPYTRDLDRSSELKNENALVSAEFLNRTLRFSPDLGFIQYQQSFDGETDIDYYGIANPVARGKIDPALKQIFGVAQEPPKTELEKAMSKYNLREWQIYRNSTAPNSNVDLVLRKTLAKSLYLDFENWSKKDIASKALQQMNIDTGKMKGMTWKEIEASDDIDNKDKAAILTGFINIKIRDTKKKVEKAFDAFVASDKVRASGYIRNNYTIYSKKNKGEGKRTLDRAAKTLGANSAEEYLSQAQDARDELERKLSLMHRADQFLKVEAQ